MNVFFLFFLFIAIVEAELEMVQVLFRHGDRAPSYSYPFDIHDENSWLRGYSQLTNQGYEQAQELGNFLRNRYTLQRKLINDVNRKTVYARSSDKDRCIETAMGVTKTLFPNELVPIHTYSSYKQDLLLKPTSLPCATADHLVQNDKKKLYEKRNKDYSEFFNFLTNKTGMHVHMDTISNLYNTVFREYANGLIQPSWLFERLELNITVFDVIIELKRQNRMETFNSFMKSKLRTGYLVGQLFNEFEEKIVKNTKRKMSLYSTHDATITSLMYTLGISNELLPPYASALIFELHKISNNHYIKVLFRNSTVYEPYTMLIPGCSNELCPLHLYRIAIDPVIIRNREEFESLCIFKPQNIYRRSISSSSKQNINIIYNIIISINVLFVIYFYFTSISKEYQ